MKRKFSTEAKVGAFVLITILLLAYLTIDVSQLGLTPRGTYTVYVLMSNAEGVTNKTPVQMAGIPIGAVTSIQLMDNRIARIGMRIRKEVKIDDNVEAQIRTRGVLGDTYIELLPGEPSNQFLGEGDSLAKVRRRADYQDLFGEVSGTLDNIKDITQTLKDYTENDKSHLNQILANMDEMTKSMAKFSASNVGNMETIVVNLRSLSADLARVSGNSSGDVQVAIKRINEITDKINSGNGTVGKLLNDPTTIDKANETLDNIHDLTQGFSRMKTELGWHVEYLGSTQDVKNYVNFKLQPRPDKYFLFEVVYDPDPSGSTATKTTQINANGAISTVTTETTSFDKVRFSAELAKKFNDFTLRGGLIESKGGFGVDYSKGPVNLQLSAFDFGASQPHLKFLTQLNLTNSIFMVGGLDDFISNQHGLDWFLGAGIRITDDDIKSLLGSAASFAH